MRSGSMNSSVLSGFKSEMPRSELNSLSTRLGAIRLREDFNSVRVQVGNAAPHKLWPGSWLNHFLCELLGEASKLQSLLFSTHNFLSTSKVYFGLLFPQEVELLKVTCWISIHPSAQLNLCMDLVAGKVWATYYVNMSILPMQKVQKSLAPHVKFILILPNILHFATRPAMSK